MLSLRPPLPPTILCNDTQMDSLAAHLDDGVHRAIKHEDLRVFWRCWFKDKEVVPWSTWWKRFPDDLLETSPELGEDVVQALKTLFSTPGVKPAFQVWASMPAWKARPRAL